MNNANDRNILQDVLNVQNALSKAYVNCACESTSPVRKNCLMNLLEEEQDMRMELLGELQKRDWYRFCPESSQKIAQICEKFKKSDEWLF